VEILVALGRGDPEPKRAIGDQRTPEGHYRVSAPARASRFHLFVPIDYPSLADAEAAHAEGRLSWGDLERVRVAHARGEAPPGDTALGGSMGFHGEGDRWRGESAALDWTYGCIAMPDDQIEFLAAHVEVGTEVWIRP
jgi:murein L,D-transpeptidase YafK